MTDQTNARTQTGGKTFVLVHGAFNEVDRGGHFAMWEHPELLAVEPRGVQTITVAQRAT